MTIRLALGLYFNLVPVALTFYLMADHLINPILGIGTVFFSFTLLWWYGLLGTDNSSIVNKGFYQAAKYCILLLTVLAAIDQCTYLDAGGTDQGSQVYLTNDTLISYVILGSRSYSKRTWFLYKQSNGKAKAFTSLDSLVDGIHDLGADYGYSDIYTAIRSGSVLIIDDESYIVSINGFFLLVDFLVVLTSLYFLESINLWSMVIQLLLRPY